MSKENEEAKSLLEEERAEEDLLLTQDVDTSSTPNSEPLVELSPADLTSPKIRRAFQENELLEDQAETVTQILTPVAITMVVVVFIVRTISFPGQDTVSSAMVYHESASDSMWARFLGSILNALIFVAMIIIVTIVFVLLYKYRCLKVIYGWLLLSTGIMLGFFGGYLFYQTWYTLNYPMDIITFAFLVWNFSIVGLISIFWQASLRVNQFYLISISVILAVVFTQLPEWTTWALLAAIAIYDLFAVLCPRGPLKVLVETAQERDEPIPALIYSASVFLLMADDEDDDSKRKRGVKLGLGDFVFYSVLVGRAALFEMLTVFTCFVAVITGLFMTILLLALFQKALPALPISIALGIVFYFLTKIFLLPLVVTLGLIAAFV